ncbi:MAG TPA: hypothetical protein VE971_04695 [Candidatus Eisenbacteria bacterium]|nr:hypothetical protein [Candidatus Eisenbacteria bacterium]
MQYKSRWVKSEFKTANSRENSNSVSLQPRIEAIRSHITEQIIELERVRCQSNTDGIIRNTIKDNDIYFPGFSENPKPNQIMLSKILLERLINQLNNVSDLGDLVIVLTPAVAILKNIRSYLYPQIPDSCQELRFICELMEVVLVDAAQLGGYTINFQTANESALQLIDEASTNPPI